MKSAGADFLTVRVFGIFLYYLVKKDSDGSYRVCFFDKLAHGISMSCNDIRSKGFGTDTDFFRQGFGSQVDVGPDRGN